LCGVTVVIGIGLSQTLKILFLFVLLLLLLLITNLVPVFFFSSRRRHTRCYRDWSSDVCSSDLFSAPTTAGDPNAREWATSTLERSEERRVGKECRSGWAPYDEKKRKDGATPTRSAMRRAYTAWVVQSPLTMAICIAFRIIRARS